MGNLVLSGATSGSTTITPTDAVTVVLTAPATTGTIALTSQIPTITAGPAFSAYLNTSNQSITASTWTKVTLNTKEFDTASAFDSTTNYRFTPLVAGYYQIQGSINLSGTANTQTTASCAIYKNGTIYKQGSTWSSASSVTVNMLQTVSAVVYLNGSTDYVELYGYNAQTSPTFTFGLSQTYFSGALVRSA